MVFFLDVGAGHYKEHSTTYYLERHLGWSGIAIDANVEYHADYLKHRPHTTYFTFFVSDKSDEKAVFFIVEKNKKLSTGVEQLARIWGKGSKNQVPTITLNDLLDRQSIKSIDFLSMDIELSEPAALAGFDIERFCPKLICIEVHPVVQQQIETYFREHNYIEIEKYSRVDLLNRYFTPAD